MSRIASREVVQTVYYWRENVSSALLPRLLACGGLYATVTRSVPLEAIVEAPTLRLKPAKSKKGRR